MSFADTIIDRADRMIWRRSLTRMPRWQAGGVLVLRWLYAVVRDLIDGQLSLRAMSLVYTTLLSLVPMLAISFSVLKGFGVHNQVKPLLDTFLRNLGPQGDEISSRIIGFIDNVNVSVLGTLGLGFLVYTVISLMQKIEGAFNYIWHVRQERSMAKRFTDYLSVILIGPLLIMMAVGLKAAVIGSEYIDAIPMARSAVTWAGNILPYILIVAAFSFIYGFIPNTRVRVGSALAGALFAGFLWQSAGWAFAAYLVGSTSYSAIYSAFATLIVFMIWLYVSWMILLLGAAMSFYHQCPQYARLSRNHARLGIRSQERLSLMTLGLIGRAFYRGEPGWTLDRLARRFSLPDNLMSDVIQPLIRAQLIAQTADERFMPGRPYEEVSVKEALDAARSETALGPRGPAVRQRDQAIEAQMNRIDSAMNDALQGITLKDLALETSDAFDPDES